MRLTKLSQYFTLLTLIFISGCMGINKKADSTNVTEGVQPIEAEEQSGDLMVDGETVEPPFVLVANPVGELSRSSTPAAAKAEFSKALALMDAKKWQEAEGLLTLLTETYPQLSGPFVNLGIVQAAREDHERAEQSWLHAIALTPTNYDAYNLLGVLYREQGRFTDAEAVYLKALAVWPHHPSSIRNLGVLYDLYMGRLHEALEQYGLYQKVIETEDRQVKGWIIDLNRRLSAQAKGQE